jgi:hypothetical protein
MDNKQSLSFIYSTQELLNRKSRGSSAVLHACCR